MAGLAPADDGSGHDPRETATGARRVGIGGWLGGWMTPPDPVSEPVGVWLEPAWASLLGDGVEVTGPARLEALWLEAARLEEPLVDTVARPGKACEATAERTPASANDPAVTQPVTRVVRPRLASRPLVPLGCSPPDA